MQPHGDPDSKPRVCRRLFPDEPTDPAEDIGVRDNVLNQAQEEINRDLDEACRKYNFDFRNEIPLEGDWKWERLVDQPADGPEGGDRLPEAPPGEQPPAGTPAPLELHEDPPQAQPL